MSAQFRTQVSGLYGGIRSYAHRLPQYFGRTTLADANRPIATAANNPQLTSESGMAYKKPFFAVGASSIAGLAVSYISSGISPEVMDSIVSSPSTIAGIAAGVGVLGLSSLALSIRQNMRLKSENAANVEQTNHISKANEILRLISDEISMQMLQHNTPETLANGIFKVTGGRTDNPLIMTELTGAILPAVFETDPSGSGAELGELLYANIGIKKPSEFIGALYSEHRDEWGLTDANLAAWKKGRSENLIAESQSVREGCDDLDVKEFEKALDLAKQAQQEHDNPETQKMIKELEGKIAELKGIHTYIVEVRENALPAFLEMWEKISGEKLSATNIDQSQEGVSVLTLKLTGRQRGQLEEMLRGNRDITVELKAIRDTILIPMVRNNTIETLVKGILDVTRGKADDPVVMKELSRNALPQIFGEDAFEQGSALGRALYTHIPLKKPGDLIAALFQGNEAGWGLTYATIAEWKNERAERLISTASDMLESCEKHNVPGLQKALDLVIEAKDEQANVAIPDNLSNLDSRVAQLSTYATYSVTVPAELRDSVIEHFRKTNEIVREVQELPAVEGGRAEVHIRVELFGASLEKLQDMLSGQEGVHIE